MLEEHLHSRTPRHRRLALAGLARIERLTDADLVQALTDADPTVRRSAARLSATHPKVDLIPTLGDSEPLVVETAAWAIGEQDSGDDAARLALEQLAVDHGDALCREAAVASLGAMAHHASLGTLLAATKDKAPVRRRAVLALVSYEGPEVDRALAAALEDRDWQVRQAAEDVS